MSEAMRQLVRTDHVRPRLGGVLPTRRRFFFVVNKQSGNYLKWLVQYWLGEFLTTEGVAAEIHYLKDVETLRQSLNRAYSEGHRRFIVVGGDGTVSLVASLLRHDDCALGIVPVGTSNMLAQLLRIPLGTRRALELLLESDCTRPVDALSMGDRIFFLNASVGLSSFSIAGLRSTEKTYLKVLAYVIAVTRGMRKAKTRRYRVEIDGSMTTIDAAELFVDNAGALVMPRVRTSSAQLDDGKADICYVRKAGPVELGKALLDVFLVRKHRQSFRYVASAVNVRIECDEVVPVQADGDTVAMTPVDIAVVPAAAKFIVRRRD
jgi:diacylglycerol kinase (ATP)